MLLAIAAQGGEASALSVAGRFADSFLGDPRNGASFRVASDHEFSTVERRPSILMWVVHP